MPLSFPSVNHGNIAFGFFNIESDMLLLEHHFFFADQFCSWMGELAAREKGSGLNASVFHIPDARDIGDLMGAIHGMHFTGFLGQIYRLFPFPGDPLLFKQNPQGNQTQNIVTAQIEKFAEKEQMFIELCQEGRVKMGAYDFDVSVFHDLIRYVWQGGYPRWKDEVRPSYVREMKTCIQNSRRPLFKGIF